MRIAWLIIGSLLFLSDSLSAATKVDVVKDIAYGRGRYLDIYSQRDTRKATAKPVILLIHGGGFWEGDKASDFYVAMAEAFALQGYVVVSINYRLKGKDEPYTRAILDTCISDVLAACRWLQVNAAAFGMDITKLIILGDSAGAGIAVNACYTNTSLFVACIDLWGGLPGDAGWQAPIYQRTLPHSAPPTLIIHGTSDRIIPYQTSERLFTQLTQSGRKAQLLALENEDHYPVALKGKIIDTVGRFIKAVLDATISDSRELTGFVNPFIGTANSGNTNPGAVLPWGMISISPFNVYDPGKPGSSASPYVFDNKRIHGFSHLNMSGLGCGDMGIVCLMPVRGSLPKGIKPSSAYSHEQAYPGYYAVSLDDAQVDVEITATCRTALSSFSFPAGENHIVLDMGMSLSGRKGGMVKLLSDTEVEGFKNIGNICGLESMQTVYFVARLSRKPKQAGVWTDGKYFDGFSGETAGDDAGAYFNFDTEDREKIMVKTAFSYVSTANAWQNLEKEQPGFDFNGTVKAAASQWQEQLSKIQVEGGSHDKQVQFYTALYHALIHPGRADDVNGEYRRFESSGKARADTHGRYSVFSLWDTYRTLHPFLSLVYPARQSAMVKSLIGMAQEGGFLPRWEYAGIETGAMTGDPSLPVIADAWMRSIRDFDINAAYALMKRNALTPEKDSYMRPGMDAWLKYGYIPEDLPKVLRPFDPPSTQRNNYTRMKRDRVVWGSVSTALEYCIADWNLAQLSKSLGKQDDYELFMKRALSYRNNFDSLTGFMRPRLANGNWLAPFDSSSHRTNAFTEGSAWNYTFMVPFDIPGLVGLMGGEENFRHKLDRCFTEKQFDITNEPDLAYPYLYNHLPGQAWRSDARVRQLLTDRFRNSPDGLPGNDDCGEISSWLLFSMMGLYPDCPGRPDYQLIQPSFKRITISLDSKYYPGKEVVIEAVTTELPATRRSYKWNGKKMSGFDISHAELVKGGHLINTTK